MFVDLGPLCLRDIRRILRFRHKEPEIIEESKNQGRVFNSELEPRLDGEAALNENPFQVLLPRPSFLEVPRNFSIVRAQIAGMRMEAVVLNEDGNIETEADRICMRGLRHKCARKAYLDCLRSLAEHIMELSKVNDVGAWHEIGLVGRRRLSLSRLKKNWSLTSRDRLSER